MLTIFTLKILCMFIFGVYGLAMAINTARGNQVGPIPLILVVGSAMCFCWCQGWLVP